MDKTNLDIILDSVKILEQEPPKVPTQSRWTVVDFIASLKNFNGCASVTLKNLILDFSDVEVAQEFISNCIYTGVVSVSLKDGIGRIEMEEVSIILHRNYVILQGCFGNDNVDKNITMVIPYEASSVIYLNFEF